MAYETAQITVLASSTNSAQVVAANRSRRALILCNTDANACFVKFGETASSSSASVILAQNAIVQIEPVYTGRIDAIWAGDGSGNLLCTEL